MESFLKPAKYRKDWVYQTGKELVSVGFALNHHFQITNQDISRRTGGAGSEGTNDFCTNQLMSWPAFYTRGSPSPVLPTDGGFSSGSQYSPRPRIKKCEPLLSEAGEHVHQTSLRLRSQYVAASPSHALITLGTGVNGAGRRS